ncbi:uncharacterized protein CLUP02_04340 [Colletotrichum lupini]|uniref:Uncharacterized protein n=1 Tax=Colletotrichum lupini TaxID=145971 RepID=A0A9Q8WD74_9PEZI|nr:uncharacterized protein CLUP02_04340 [Colletotrichum lupini]UQC78861.1 hypothetical protein CLUP02_04340 [Colletotrichum lupini]
MNWGLLGDEAPESHKLSARRNSETTQVAAPSVMISSCILM